MSKKKSIVDTTISLIAENGILGTSTASIAKVAGVATGTLFHHFPTKKELIEYAYLQIQGNYASSTQELLLGGNNDLNYRTVVFIQKAIDYWLDHSKQFEFTRQVFNSKYYTQDLDTKVEEINNGVKIALELGCTENILRESDPSFLMAMIFTTLLTTVRLILETNNEEQKEKFRQEGFVFIWNAVKKEEELV